MSGDPNELPMATDMRELREDELTKVGGGLAEIVQPDGLPGGVAIHGDTTKDCFASGFSARI
jgi:hypothetical protein